MKKNKKEILIEDKVEYKSAGSYILDKVDIFLNWTHIKRICNDHRKPLSGG